MLWVIFAGLSLMATGILAWPLIAKGADRPAPGANADEAVYRAQLGELTDDLGRGLIDAREATTARLEIERRLLGATAAEPAAETADGTTGAPRQWRPAALIALALPALAFAVYAGLGSPGIPALPFAEQTRRDPDQADLKALTTRLAAKMAERPDNVEGWRLLGRSYSVLGQYGAAAEAFRRAVAVDGADAASQLSLAENLTLAADGTVSDEARKIFTLALGLEPGQPGARYYLALADFQAGEVQAAYDGWLALAGEAPPDAPWLEAVTERLGEAAQVLGIAPPAPLASPATAKAARPGPDAGDIAGAAAMDEGDRKAFIESMVARLATRLESEPDDTEGWFKLARAYTVLGRHGDAARAYDRILSRDPDNREALWLAGGAAAAQGDSGTAEGHWRRLLGQLDPASRDYADLRARIGELSPEK